MPKQSNKLSSNQAKIIIDQFVEQLLDESKKQNNGQASYAFATGALSVVATSLLAGERNYTLELLIEQAGFSK